MNEGIDEQDLQKKIDSTIIQDHKYCLDRCTEIIKEKDRQIKRKDITIIILGLLLGLTFLIFIAGYIKTPPIKTQNNVQLTDSDGNNIGVNSDRGGMANE